ncbi:MAG: hypothetical protein V1824_04455 [archaeon]
MNSQRRRTHTKIEEAIQQQFLKGNFSEQLFKKSIKDENGKIKGKIVRLTLTQKNTPLITSHSNPLSLLDSREPIHTHPAFTIPNYLRKDGDNYYYSDNSITPLPITPSPDDLTAHIIRTSYCNKKKSRLIPIDFIDNKALATGNLFIKSKFDLFKIIDILKQNIPKEEKILLNNLSNIKTRQILFQPIFQELLKFEKENPSEYYPYINRDPEKLTQNHLRLAYFISDSARFINHAINLSIVEIIKNKYAVKYNNIKTSKELTEIYLKIYAEFGFEIKFIPNISKY